MPSKRTGTRTYNIWKAIRYRAKHKPTKSYALVELCESWDKYENFIADMGECPSPKHSIDRIDNSKGYVPDNCRWATSKEQVANRSNTDWIEYKGEKKHLTDWSEELQLPRLALHQRLYKLGWSVEKAFTTPLRKFKGSIRGNARPGRDKC